MISVEKSCNTFRFGGIKRMSEWIKSMIEQMEALNAGYMKIGFGEYSVIIADKETTEYIEAALDEEEVEE